MKYFALFILTFIIYSQGCSSGKRTKNPYKRIEISSLDNHVLNRAEKISTEFFYLCEKGRFEDILSKDYSTPKLYQLIHHRGYDVAGDFVKNKMIKVEAILLQEALTYKGLLRVFRYKINCTGFDYPIEFRMMLTYENELSEFHFYEWSDEYKGKALINFH